MSDSIWFDRWVGTRLAAGGYVSRRSVLGTAARGLLALVGVTVVGRRLPADVGTGTNFSACAALHGYTCEGKCQPNNGKNKNCVRSDTTKSGSGWVGCCQMGVGNEFSCLNLWDWVCEEREDAADLKTCAGVGPGSSPLWWKGTFTEQYGGGAGPKYLCTEYEDLTPKPAKPGDPLLYDSEESCATNCSKPVPNPGPNIKNQFPCDDWCKKMCKYTWNGANWITADTCAGDGSTCICKLPAQPGMNLGDIKTTKCEPSHL